MNGKTLNPWSWVPALYFIEGLPNVVVLTTSTFFYKDMGLDNPTIAMLTSLFYIPWAVKGFWSPIVDAISSKRKWIFNALGFLASLFLVLAVSPMLSNWLLFSLVVFWMISFASATFDIAADGFYMMALTEKEQSFFVGIRNSFYRLAIVFGQGGLLWIAGDMAQRYGDVKTAWASAFGVCALIAFIGLALFSKILPKPAEDISKTESGLSSFAKDFFSSFAEFFRKNDILPIMLFILFYRFAESQVVKIVPLFLKDSSNVGGLALSTKEISLVYGINAPVSLLAGGIIGGICISKFGLKTMMIPMVLALNLTSIVYVYLAASLQKNLFVVGGLISIEQFGYGFGFAAYMMFLIHIVKGARKTSHYAIATSFMALGMIAPSFISGHLQAYFGYTNFFIWIMIATSVSFAVTAWAYLILKKEELN